MAHGVTRLGSKSSERLWKDFFRDSSLRWDCRLNKVYLCWLYGFKGIRDSGF